MSAQSPEGPHLLFELEGHVPRLWRPLLPDPPLQLVKVGRGRDPDVEARLHLRGLEVHHKAGGGRRAGLQEGQVDGRHLQNAEKAKGDTLIRTGNKDLSSRLGTSEAANPEEGEERRLVY